MLLKGIYSDIKLVVNSSPYETSTGTTSATTTIIHAHRKILTERSHYFKAMLGGSYAEPTSSEVEIQEVDGDSFHELVKAMYAGKWPDNVRVETSLFMLHSIPRFGTNLLNKPALINSLKGRLTVGNVLLTLHDAKRLDLGEAVEICRAFVFKYHCTGR